MEEQLKEIMGDILNLDAGSVDGSTSKDNTASWDSLNHINLVVALEQEFGLLFDLQEIESMLSYDQILQVLERKLQG